MHPVLCQIQNGVAHLTLNRPKIHNAFDDELIGALTEQLKALNDDRSVRAVVLCGAGKSFSAGADLGWMKRMAQASEKENRKDARQLAKLMRTLNALGKPTIARVQGAAMGGGVGLVACCDIAVASDGARFALSETRLGLVPAVISPYVVDAIGARQARRYFLTAETFDAATARALGLVHEVVAENQLDATIDALAAEPHPGLGFIPDPPGGGPGSECDLYFQDCAPDEKCLPWSNDGGDQLNGTRCNPVPPMPDLLGDSCTSEAGGLAGIDSCDHGLICWEGACQELCGCSEAHPVCSNPATACVVSHDGWVPLCEPLCNPLDPLACAVGEGCYPLEGLFFCAPDASAGGGGPGDPCTNANSCDPGTVCVEGSLVPGCLGDACCTPLCSAGGGGVVCLPGQVCVPWYEDGAEPDNCLGKVRVCIDP